MLEDVGINRERRERVIVRESIGRAQRAVHSENACLLHLGQLGKGRAPAAPANDTSKATTVKVLTDTFDWAIGVVGQLTAADLTKSFGSGKGPSMTGLDLLYQAMIHTAHTRGYGEMYLRNKGVA